MCTDCCAGGSCRFEGARADETVRKIIKVGSSANMEVTMTSRVVFFVIAE